ncbi:MAG: bifunctional serine/threonine-protein kinase/formylglycine-generating enzyme family protein [Planctomycetota bacterium]
MAEDCPSKELLRRLVTGEHTEEELEQLAAHLGTCQSCRKAVEDIGGDLGALRRPPPDKDAPSERQKQTLEIQADKKPGVVLPQGIVLDAPRDSKYLGRLDEYDVERVIGAGGMGVVVKAYQESLNRSVAIKIMNPTLAQNAVARRRFLDEARHAAELGHDNIVTIHAVSATSERPYIVMSYVKGMSLAELIEAEAPLAPEKAARIARQMLSGLGHAHARRKVHRDIKPANIMLENHIEKVKITDFGIAVSVGQVIRHSEPGQVLGTPAYMSPEQAAGELDVDARSDLFSVGTILYEMLTGLLPFNATSAYERMHKVMEVDPAPVRSLSPSVPDKLSRIVERAMQKDIHARYQTAGDFEQDLSHFLGEAPPKRKRSKPHKWVVTVVVIAAIAVVLLFSLKRPDKPARPQPRPASEVAAVPPARPDETASDAPEKTASPPPAWRRIGEVKVPVGFRVKPDTQPEPYTNTGWALEVVHEKTGVEMVFIPAGDFEMGSPSPGGVRQSDENPAHTVRITRPFYMGKCEITQEEWTRVMGSNPSHFKDNRSPVESVSWNDCQTFCKRTGLRLPSEAEWEYACRADTTWAYCFGDDPGDLGTHAWYTDNSGGSTHPVGEKRPNGWGLHDMHGNVWEWCADWWGDYYYSQSPREDPHGPSSGECRVLRGGSWNNNSWHCRSAFRFRNAPTFSNPSYGGFRVARGL